MTDESLGSDHVIDLGEGRTIYIHLMQRGLPLELVGREANRALSFFPPETPAGSVSAATPLDGNLRHSRLWSETDKQYFCVDTMTGEATWEPLPKLFSALPTSVRRRSAPAAMEHHASLVTNDHNKISSSASSSGEEEEEAATKPQRAWAVPPPSPASQVLTADFPELPLKRASSASAGSNNNTIAQPLPLTMRAKASSHGASPQPQVKVITEPIRLSHRPQIWYVRHASMSLEDMELRLYKTLQHNDFRIREHRNKGGFIDFFTQEQRDEAHLALLQRDPPAKDLVSFDVVERQSLGCILIDPMPRQVTLHQLVDTFTQFGAIKSANITIKEGKPMGVAKIRFNNTATPQRIVLQEIVPGLKLGESPEEVLLGPYPAILGINHAKQVFRAYAQEEISSYEFQVIVPTVDSEMGLIRFTAQSSADLACRVPVLIAGTKVSVKAARF